MREFVKLLSNKGVVSTQGVVLVNIPEVVRFWPILLMTRLMGSVSVFPICLVFLLAGYGCTEIMKKVRTQNERILSTGRH